MIPTDRYYSSTMPLDLNEDQNHHLFSPNHEASSSSSSLSYYNIVFNPNCWEPKTHLQSDGEVEKIIIPCSGLRNQLGGNDRSSGNSLLKFEEQKQALASPLGTDNIYSNNYNSSQHSNVTVRACADCHTTKTPLWRTGPTGPKSLCNACGIRQRKVRRAAMAAASTNSSIIEATEKSPLKKNKLHNKEKKKKQTLKNKRKLGAKASLGGRKKLIGLEEDLTIRLSKNLALQVFPQDEKEAAILLMALSCDHGRASTV